jgi:predicted PurR-regulated permease PerM
MDDLNKAVDCENQGDWLSRERALTLVLIVATALAVYLCYLLARPLLPALAWALALAVTAHPLHDWLARRIPWRNLAAGVPVFIAVVGRITLFGSAGLILGPVTLAVAVALADLWRRRTTNGRLAGISEKG